MFYVSIITCNIKDINVIFGVKITFLTILFRFRLFNVTTSFLCFTFIILILQPVILKITIIRIFTQKILIWITLKFRRLHK